MLDGVVKVTFKGGSLDVFMNASGKLCIRGQVHHVFDATLKRIPKANKAVPLAK